jgi:Uncharacterised nucleotidyltransferase
VPGAGGTSAPGGAGVPARSHAASVASSELVSTRRDSPRYGGESAPGGHGGISRACVIFTIARAYCLASAAVVSAKGATPPSVWHETQCALRMVATDCQSPATWCVARVDGVVAGPAANRKAAPIATTSAIAAGTGTRPRGIARSYRRPRISIRAVKLAEPALRATAQTLAVDLATAEVFAALADAGIEAMLLRGPVVARRFYGDAPRDYVDVDVLVPPAARARTRAVLQRLGYRPLASDDEVAGHRPLHAREWVRADGVSVDLHRTVSGARAPDERVWSELAARAERASIAGTVCAVPRAAASALVVALHAAHNGPRGAKPLADLERALAVADDVTWREAAALAERIDATAALAAGLQLVAGGAELVGRLELPEAQPIETRLRSAGAPPLALGIEWLAHTRGVRAKAALVASVVVPRPGALRTWRALARRGRWGLAFAYVSQPFWLARHAVPSLRALRRARREVA